MKTEVESEITWDVRTVTEDTNFIWRAFADPDREMAVVPVKLLNQAPPSVRAMISQRRRWISGASLDSQLLPRRYRALSLLRNAAWGLVVFSPLLLIPVLTPVSVVYLPGVFELALLCQLVGLYSWGFLGYWYYAERFRVLLGLALTLPIVAILHATGALWAIFHPTTTFEVTPKVPPSGITDGVARDSIGDAVDDLEEQPAETPTEAPTIKHD
ncbi:MAG: glycosyltransferase family 2 protein [Natrialbaceae archaeon]|nr:glycosyltransferase family 2 protein [Natrialbaceae archaeon]